MSTRKDDFLAEVKELMSQLQPGTIEEANAALKQLQDRRNFSPVPEFSGLSPAMMHRFLSVPFDSPELIEYPHSVAVFPDGFRLVSLFELLVSAIGEKGVKTTVNGNLPQAVLRSIAAEWLTSEEYGELIRYTTIRTESEFSQLHTLRLVSEMAGMIRKIHGKFVTTKVCLQLQNRSGFNEIYPRLFKAYTHKLNWQYLRPAPEVAFMQKSFAFSIYLFDKFGEDWRPVSFYDDAFENAFPQLAEENEDIVFGDHTVKFDSRFTRCNIVDFGDYFGFLEAKYAKSNFVRHVTEVRKTELLGQLVRFRVAGG